MTIKSTKAAFVNYHMRNEFLNIVPNFFTVGPWSPYWPQTLLLAIHYNGIKRRHHK